MGCRLRNQAVAICYWGKPGTFTRRVVGNGAFPDFRKNQSINKTGSRESGGFLPAIPCSENPVALRDKTLRGKGRRSAP